MMTDKKLTDNEIVKLLECCKKSQCSNCEYSKKCDGYTQVNYALDLITRQQSKIDKLKTELKAMRGAANSLKMHYEEAQAEIERLKKTEIEIDDFCRRLCRMRMLNGNAIASYEDLQNYIQQEKSEAVKEFAERLKEEYAQGINWFGTKEHYFVNVEDIDNLVKEMVGENND